MKLSSPDSKLINALPASSTGVKREAMGWGKRRGGGKKGKGKKITRKRIGKIKLRSYYFHPLSLKKKNEVYSDPWKVYSIAIHTVRFSETPELIKTVLPVFTITM